jgi:hypothetical protein
VHDVDKLTERLKKARQDQMLSEEELQDWISLSERVKQQLITRSPAVGITENPIQSTRSPFHVFPSVKHRSNSARTDTNISVCTDRFEYCHGNAKIEDNGCLITNGSDSFFGTEIRGRLEYSSGSHLLRFQIENNPSKIWIFIGIVAKITDMGANLFTQSSVYGWGDYNDYFLAGERQKDDSDVFSIYTQEKDIIELTVNCSTRTITYENKDRQKRQKLHIDTTKCPFPWQLYISLGGRDDQIRLLDASAIV